MRFTVGKASNLIYLFKSELYLPRLLSVPVPAKHRRGQKKKQTGINFTDRRISVGAASDSGCLNIWASPPDGKLRDAVSGIRSGCRPLIPRDDAVVVRMLTLVCKRRAVWVLAKSPPILADALPSASFKHSLDIC